MSVDCQRSAITSGATYACTVINDDIPATT